MKKNLKILNFLKSQPEVVSVKRLNKRDNFGNIIVKTRLAPNTHPARGFFIAHYLLEKSEKLQISICRDR